MFCRGIPNYEYQIGKITFVRASRPVNGTSEVRISFLLSVLNNYSIPSFLTSLIASSFLPFILSIFVFFFQPSFLHSSPPSLPFFKPSSFFTS